MKLRKEIFQTDSEINIPEYLTESDKLPGPENIRLRGVHSSMYRSKFWTMRQYAGFATTGRIQQEI